MKVNYLFFAFFIFICTLSVQMCTTLKTAEEFTSDPISSLGHGAFLDGNGKEFTPEADFIERAQQFYIKKILRNPAAKSALSKEVVERKRREIDAMLDDKILANALYVDWLMEKTKPENAGNIAIINNALRWHYVLKIQKDPLLPTKNKEWTKGIKPEIAEKLGGVGVQVLSITNKNGEAYCRECLEAGVPVPKKMYGSEWKSTLASGAPAIIDNEFISENNQAELLIYESESPKGVCLALPRFPVTNGIVGQDAVLFGVICLGTVTNKVCFFDNPGGRTFRRNVEVDFKEWLGGTDLVANGQGMCTDCHAGENPYVVHPEKPAFAGIINKIRSTAWYNPLVDASWVQNPGPGNLLDAYPDGRQCNGCHVAGFAGRFPEISSQLSGYCNSVLKNAVGRGAVPAKQTMPQGNLTSISLYAAQVDAMLRTCGAAPPGGGVEVPVNYPNDPGFISPPIVIGPLYQCATSVSVRGVILNAKVKLLVNGSGVGSISPARNPNKTEFTGLPELRVGDVVTATQDVNGVVSGSSAPVTVRDYKADYPSGLPAPAIDPALIYQCGNIIAVRHLPGAKITVYTNGGNPVSVVGSTDWTGIYPGKRPFNIGDVFTAEIALCGEVSPRSAPATAIAAPATLPAPTFDPANIYAGQELVNVGTLTNGSVTAINVTGVGGGDFTTPISWFPDFDITTKIGRPLQSGDVLTGFQKLCIKGPGTTTPTVKRCEELPAPSIQHPVVGNDFVVVTQATPGARIRVYDGNGIEIGDGSGSVIKLKRAINGTDTITVVQQLGECTGKNGYRVSVRNFKNM